MGVACAAADAAGLRCRRHRPRRVYAIGGLDSSSGIVSSVEAYTFDACDYIEYEINDVWAQIDSKLTVLEDPEMPPQWRSEVRKEIGELRIQLKSLVAQLKKCRGA